MNFNRIFSIQYTFTTPFYGPRVIGQCMSCPKKNNLKLSVSEFTSLPTFYFDYKKLNEKLYTIFTYEMLKRGYLASNSIYLSYAHKHKDLVKYLKNKIPKNITLITGGLRREFDNKSFKLFNSLYVVNNETFDFYDKKKLVPFGDYFPQNFLINWFSEIFKIPMSNFKSGVIINKPFQIGDFNFAISICYEDIFSFPLAYQINDANFILNFTNDAWWGDSIGPDQHLQMAIMRAIEFGKPMIRSTNNGISTIINEDGNVIEIANRDTIEIIESASYGTIGSTPFSIYGNKLIYLILLTFGIYIIFRRYFSVSQ